MTAQLSQVPIIAAGLDPDASEATRLRARTALVELATALVEQQIANLSARALAVAEADVLRTRCLTELARLRAALGPISPTYARPHIARALGLAPWRVRKLLQGQSGGANAPPDSRVSLAPRHQRGAAP